jgi:hypothetical protein
MTKIPELDTSLLEALIELDKWLKRNNLHLELKIIGASALYLHHVEIDRPTIDIDLANDIKNHDILVKIEEIGKSYGLGSTWLETPGVVLPEFFRFESHKQFNSLSNIDAKIADLKTLLGLKISAYHDRMNETQIDLIDAKAIIDYGVVLSEDILSFAISDIKNSPRYSEKSLEIVLKDLKLQGLMQ